MFLLMDEGVLRWQWVKVLLENQLAVAEGLTGRKRSDEWRVRGWSMGEQKKERERRM